MSDVEPFAVRCHAIVAAAGSGIRAGAALPKQYVPIAGRPMVAHAIAALRAVSRIDRVVVVVAAGDDGAFERHVGDALAAQVVVARCGGATRAASVAGGIAELARLGSHADDWVLVHDAARCLVRPGWIESLLDACWGDPVGGLLAVPVADTLKRASAGRSRGTLDREHVWQAQTPQMFRSGLLGEALAGAGDDVTDEAGAVEHLGFAPKLVPGSRENWKVTHAGDFAIAEDVLRQRERSAR